MKESLLIITYDMIPFSSTFGACQRMLFLTNFLADNGYNVYVIHLKSRFYSDFGNEMKFVSAAVSFKNKFFNKLILSELYRKNNNANRRRAGLFGKLKSLIKKIVKSVDNILFNEPNSGMGILGRIWVENVEKEVINLIKDKQVRNVIISGPPFSLFSLAKFIKRQSSEVKVILDYRDPWNLRNNSKGFSYWKEKKYLNTADFIVVYSDVFKTNLVKEFNIDENKVYTVMNGFSEKVWDSLKLFEVNSGNKKKRKLIISYIGSINLTNTAGYRNPLELLEAYKEFEYKNDMIVRFIGVHNGLSEIENVKKIYGSGLEIQGQIPLKDSLLEMMRSNVLLLLYTGEFNSAKYMYGAKFFDYIRSGKVIWGIGNRSFLANEMIEEYRLGITSENTKKEILEKMYLLYSFWKNDKLLTLRENELLDINMYSRESQNKKYLEVLKRLK